MIGTESTPDDYRLMEAVAAGDASAMKTFYDRHSGLVFTVCLRVLGDRQDAEDVLVDVFYEAWEKAQRFDAGRGSPVAYLVQIARCRAIDRLRARKGMVLGLAEREEADRTEDPAVMGESEEQREMVVRALDGLDPLQREAVERSFYDGMSHSEIAQRMGRPLGTVKTYIRQGLIRLRDSLRKAYEGGVS